MSMSDHQSSIFIIAGMHRSGTSLTASLLQSMGVDIGQRLVGSTYGNIKGHFENIDFVDFHKEVLRSQGIDEQGFTVQNEIFIPEFYLEKAQEIVRKNSHNPLWGWKDPRTTLFLDFWIKLLPTANFIFVYRSPWEVVDSLYRRSTDEIIIHQPEMAVKAWIHYNQKVLEFYNKFPERCILASVYTISNYAQEFAQVIHKKFAVHLEAVQSNIFEAKLLETEISKTHRPSLIYQCFAEALEIYRELDAKGLGFKSDSDFSSKQEVYPAFQPISAFQDWLDLRKVEKENKILKTDLSEWQTQFQEAQTKLVSLETELGQTQLKLQGTEHQFTEAQTKLVSLETELGQTQLKLQGTEHQFTEAQTKLVSLETELGQTQLKLQGTEHQFTEAQTKLVSLETELGQTQLKLQGTEHQFTEAQTKLVSLETELGQTQLKLQGTEHQFTEARSNLVTLEAELGSQQEQLNITQIELERSRAENAALVAEIATMQSSKFWQLRERYYAFKRRLQLLGKLFLFEIDSPTNWNLAAGNFQLSGWCFSPNQFKVEAIRARVGNQLFEGVYGIGRGDVAQAYRGISGTLESGFSIPVSLTLGHHELILEALTFSNQWQRVASYSLCISMLQAAIDVPQDWHQKNGVILFAGWCCHPEQRIEQLILSVGDISVECSYGNYRPDVGKVYPDWKDSAASGWEAMVAVPQGTWKVALKATLANGEVAIFQIPQPLIVQRESVFASWKKRWQQAVRFTELVRKKAYDRRIRLGRVLPTLTELPHLVKTAVKLYREQQQLQSELTPPGFIIPQPIEPYEAWLRVNQWNEKAQNYLLSRLKSCQGNLPKISVVMPVYNPPLEFLDRAIASVINQVYQNWELCIADDCSTNPAIGELLQKWTAKDNRIRVIFREQNGNISAATNSAASLATGEFLLFLDHDDELTPDALGEVALYLAEYPETDFLYSDDDKIDTAGQRYAPQFKPDWSPELLLSYMYLSHLCTVRRELFETVGGMRVGFEGSQDYDFALRATEKASHIAHLPLVLYHWRATPGSTAVTGAAKPKSFIAGEKALQETFQRRGILGTAYQPDWALKLGLGLFSHQFPDNGPSVTLIIPTKNQVKLLKNCLTSLEKTTYQNYHVLIVDNESDDPETLAYFKQISHRVLPVKNTNGKFSFAAVNNRAAEQATTDYVLFLNNDIEVIAPNWLSQMVGYAQIENVGAVGARLLFPDGRVQHAGVIHGMHHGLAGHAFKLIAKDDGGYLSYATVVRNYSAVTAACLLTPRQLFLELGGFDEQEFAVAYNDADYGYRLLEKGYRSVYCPTAELTHYEGTSRGFKDNPREVAAYRQKYGQKVDSFYSPHLSLENEQVQIQARRIFPGKLSPLKVLMCSNDLNFTGGPLHQYEIAVKLAKQGMIQPIIFCPFEGPLREAYEQQGIEVIVREHPLANIYTEAAYDEALQKLGEEIQQYNIDLIYANTLNNFFIVDCAQKLGIPSVWNLHESEPWQTYFNHFGAEIAARALQCFRYPYQIIFVADATRDIYLPLNSHHNFTVIHNGLDLEQLKAAAQQWTRLESRKSLEVAPEDVVILLLGTVCDRKGQQDLVRALSHLPQPYHHSIRCFIVGDRPSYYSRQLAKLAAELPESLQQRLAIVPETKDTARYYQAADIFVCTSRIESFPRVILEAMAYNLPIVTTPVFGIQEQVREGVNGLFYTPGKAEELANAIASLLDNESLRKLMAENSPYVLRSLNTFEEMTQAYAEIFHQAYLSMG